MCVNTRPLDLSTKRAQKQPPKYEVCLVPKSWLLNHILPLKGFEKPFSLLK